MNIARMEKFEQLWAQRHDIPAESLAQYRFESREGYRLPELAAHYRTHCEALEHAEECSRRAQAIQIHESPNVESIIPLADRAEFVLSDEQFDSFTALLNVGKNCRQQLASDGKPYPRSSCEICGAFSPKWRECDARIAAEAKDQ